MRIPRRLMFMVTSYIAVWTVLDLRRYGGLNSTTFDLGIHAEIMEKLSHGLAPELSTRGLNAMGDHYSPIAYLLIPFYWLFPSPLTLLETQTVVLALGAFPVYRLARRALGTPGYGLLLASLYLCQPILHYCNRFDFHLSCFFIPLLLWALDSLEEGRMTAYLVGLALVLATGEAAGFSLLALAPLAWLRRGTRWGLTTALVGGLGLGAAVLTMRTLSQGLPTAYTSLYARWGSSGSEILLNLAEQPQNWIPLLLDPSWLGQAWLPLAGLCLLAPERMLPALPVMLGNQLSWRQAQHGLDCHYNAAVLPFLMWAAVGGAARLKSWLESRGEPPLQALGWMAALGAVIGLWLGPLSPWADERPREEADQIATALAQLPPEADTSAQNLLGPRLVNGQRHLYLFPNPIQQAAWGYRAQALAEQSEHALHPPLPGEARRCQEQAPVEYLVLMPRSMGFPVDWQDLPVYLQMLSESRVFGLVKAAPDLLIFARGQGGRLGPQDWPVLYRPSPRRSWPASQSK